MTDWNDMTPEEKTVAVLTKVCGWKIMADDHYLNPAVDPRYWTPASNLPPILESADACIEHVGRVIEDRGYWWEYKSALRKAYVWNRLKMVSFGHGNLAPALCEAAYRMMEGEEG